MHGAIEDHGRAHAGKRQGTNEGYGLPVPVRHRRPAALATARPPAASGHLDCGAGFVDEDQSQGVEVGLQVEPVPSAPQDIRPLLFACVSGFF